MTPILKLAAPLALLTAALGTYALAQQPRTTFTVVRAAQWGGQNLNPFSPADQHLQATNSAIYETLFYVNGLNGKVTNVLGTKYTWSKDNRTLTVATRPGVRWHDGRAFSAADVAFTFNYMKQYPALDLSGVWKNGLTGVRASGNTVTFTFNRANTPIFFYIANQAIVPQHLWSAVTDPVTYTNAKPVGTGPFTFDAYSQQAVRVLKNPTYWIKGQPYVDAVVWRATSGNDAALLQLLKNEADYGYVGIPDPKGGYASKGPNYQYWWPTNNSNFLYFNTTKAPFNDAAFRRAVAGAINTKDVALKAYSGVVGAAPASAVIPAQQSEWLPASMRGMTAKFDAAAADRALTAAGYRKNAQGVRLGKDGQPLPTYKILVGAGWTDFITMAQVIGDNLKRVGITTSIDQQQWSSYAGGLQTATYDMGVSWGWGNGPSPYYLFYSSFSPELSAAVGKTAPSNLSRYTNPALTQAIASYRSTSDPAAQEKAVATMVSTVMRDMPWVPLTDRAQFSLFNTSKFTNFPSAQNPYNDGSPDDVPGARLMYLNVKPK
ncbi:ABC transporter substrate-binding protein [Deinococcus sp. YIM 134068]|uniref:ABC transporter substrate-binding protein n=1 Tax=Deinococcus lichenicola TaxID=3118910 RepID=UPI002F936B49